MKKLLFNLFVPIFLFSCSACPGGHSRQGAGIDSDQEVVSLEDTNTSQREIMVRDQLSARGIEDQEVLKAMTRVPRHLYVPLPLRDRAYQDSPLPIGRGQTISQPYIVALMTEVLAPRRQERILEIGTGSGYQAAVLGELAGEVYSIEIICDLAETARSVLDEQGYDNVKVRCGDGYQGWPDKAPFDAIMVTAAPPDLPEALLEQLRPGGRMVVPVGRGVQQLKLITKNHDGSRTHQRLLPVRFVPMVRGDDDISGSALPQQ